MTLTTEDKERLAQILEANRRGHGGFYNARSVAPTTDESVALIRHGERSKQVPYHACADGEPACGAESDHGYRPEDMEVAEAWRPPCKLCYHDELETNSESETSRGEA